MNPREKIMIIAATSALALGVLYLLANRVVLSRAREYATDEATLSKEKAELEQETDRLKRRVYDFARLRDRTFEDNTLRASLRATSRLSQIATQAGLGQESYTITPITKSGTAKTFGQVVCTFRGRSSLQRVTNLLYLLRRDPYLHRVSNLQITPEPRGGAFSFELRYVTPVFDRKLPIPLPARKTSTTQMAELASLNEPRRAEYDVVQKRNFFKPYVPPAAVVQRPPRRRQGPPQRQPPDPPPAPLPQSPYDGLVVTGLSSRGGQPEVCVGRPGQDVEKVYKVGDKLQIGQIAMVDYRVLPMPGKPDELSASRVILKIGKDYLAVEAGQRLGDRRVLRRKELPESLRTPSAGGTQ